MDIRKLNDDLSVTGQIAPADVSQIASLGFRAIVCNRPDDEEPGQPLHAAIEAEAAKHGLGVHYQPVRSSGLTDTDADAFGAYLDKTDKPVLAYCRSGTRCTALWSLWQATQTPVQQILEQAGEAGYDMHGLLPRLQARQEKASL